MNLQKIPLEKINEAINTYYLNYYNKLKYPATLNWEDVSLLKSQWDKLWNIREGFFRGANYIMTNLLSTYKMDGFIKGNADLEIRKFIEENQSLIGKIVSQVNAKPLVKKKLTVLQKKEISYLLYQMDKELPLSKHRKFGWLKGLTKKYIMEFLHNTYHPNITKYELTNFYPFSSSFNK